MSVSVNSRPSRPSSASISGYRNSTILTQIDVEDLSEIQKNITRMRKAKKIRFLCNGDRFNKGVVMAVAPERYRSFDSLLSDLTRAFSGNINLPSGVRNLYTTDGERICNMEDLEDGKLYVCSGNGDSFKKVDYTTVANRVRPARSLSKIYPVVNNAARPAYNSLISHTSSESNDVNGKINGGSVLRPRIIILVRNGNRPRRVTRLLLNKRNAPSFDQTLSTITDAVKLDTGAARKIFNSSGIQLTSLHDFWGDDDVFFAYGSERINAEDFELDFEEELVSGSSHPGGRKPSDKELKAIQAQKRTLRKPVAELKNGTHCMDASGRKVPKLPNTTKHALQNNGRSESCSTNMPSKLLSRYTVGHILGDGNFAVVRRCMDKVKNVEYALKIIDKSKLAGKEHMIENEVSILRTVNHPNIIRLIAEHDTPNELYLIMELVKGGDLFDAIMRMTKFSEPNAQIMTRDLASALAYLHDNSILHRDIKPENLLVDMDGDDVKKLKVGDFGLAQKVTEPLFAVCGTPTYVAPEILTEVGYDLKIDIWAAGVILYILLCGFPPFVSSTNNQEELFEDILSGQYGFPEPYWDDVSDEAKDLISHMLQSNPQLRFSAEDILDHPWLAP